MKVRLISEASIKHKAGEIVEVSPEEGFFLCSLSKAEEVKDGKTTNTTQRKTKKK